MSSGTRTIRVPFAAGDAARAGSATPASFARAGIGASSSRRRRSRASACCCTSAPSITDATVWVNGLACRHARRRLHAVLASTSRVLQRRQSPRDRRARRRRSRRSLAKPRGKQDWQLEPHSIWYPRTTGIWQTVWMERVPPTLDRHGALDAERRALGDRLRGAGSSGERPRRPAARTSSCASATCCWPTTPITVVGGRSAPPHRALRSGHRRLPQRAALESRDARRSSTPSSTLWGGRGELLDDGRAATPRCARSACRATASCSTAGRTRCAWCSTRATGRRAG